MINKNLLLFIALSEAVLGCGDDYKKNSYGNLDIRDADLEQIDADLPTLHSGPCKSRSYGDIDQDIEYHYDRGRLSHEDVIDHENGINLINRHGYVGDQLSSTTILDSDNQTIGTMNYYYDPVSGDLRTEVYEGEGAILAYKHKYRYGFRVTTQVLDNGKLLQRISYVWSNELKPAMSEDIQEETRLIRKEIDGEFEIADRSVYVNSEPDGKNDTIVKFSYDEAGNLLYEEWTGSTRRYVTYDYACWD